MKAPPRSAPEALMRVTTPPVYSGGNEARLLRGGEALFPAMVRAIEGARHEVWLATYIYDNTGSVDSVTQALADAARRGVQVKVLVDGFGSRSNLPELRSRLEAAGVLLAVFRPLHNWWSWLQPSQLRRLHQKICVVDGDIAFVGGINLLDDRFDQVHGWSDQPRLDYAVTLRGPIVAPMEQSVRALWTRASVGRNFAREMKALAKSAEPVARARRLIRRLRMPQGAKVGEDVSDLPPVRLLGNGVRVFEYTPAFLHAKVGLVDDEWATVGSSNIDPLSLLLNLEANVVVRDADFNHALAAQFDEAVAASVEIDPTQARRRSLQGALQRGFIAWVAHVYLRIAGTTGRY
jgi:phosphatidylserine/phosphatidylglycerophosphate/cardiolipin synthase-like enzyme